MKILCSERTWHTFLNERDAPRIWQKTANIVAPLKCYVLRGDSERDVMVVLVFLSSERSSKHKCRRQGAGVGTTLPLLEKYEKFAIIGQKSALSQAKSFKQWILY